jgi:hypothetical protein
MSICDATSSEIVIPTTLAVSGPKSRYWIELLQSLQHTPEIVYILSHIDYIDVVGILNMSRLKELHISDPNEDYQSPRRKFYAVEAPRLRRFVTSFGVATNGKRDLRASLVATIENTQQIYPPLKEVMVVARSGKFIIWSAH